MPAIDDDEPEMSEAPEWLRRLAEGPDIILLGDYLRFEREKKGWPRTTLAKFARMSPNSLVKYERAGYPDGQYPPIPKLAKICELLDIDPTQAFEHVLLGGAFLPEKRDFSFLDHRYKNIYDKHYERRDQEAERLEMRNAIRHINQRLDEMASTLKENGPDQNDPSRHPQNPSTAVDAALTPPKEEDQT